MSDIIERLKDGARKLSVKCICDKKDCILCQPKLLMTKAANEIEELRSLMEAIKDGR